MEKRNDAAALEELLLKLRSPEKAYSPAAFWFWYGSPEKAELTRQIGEMVAQGVDQGFMHPRAYFTTPYLEEEWWDTVAHCVEASRKAGFVPWLYDEYAWPSGTAGSTFKYSRQKPSRTLAKGEAYMAKGLDAERRVLDAPARAGDLVPADAFSAHAAILDAAGKVVPGGLLELRSADGTVLPAGTLVLVFRRRVYGGAVDYLNKEAIAEFIRLTHEEYAARHGADFGSLIPGIFFDEIFNAPSPIVWTDGFAEAFRARRGYALEPLLPYLILDGAEAAALRRDYHSLVAELYEEAFFEPLGRWCAAHGIALTGHTEEWIAEHPLRQGDYFRTMRHLQIPGADCHDYRYRYPRTISPVEAKGAVSVARLNRRERAMSEALGGGGWATPLQEFKRGVNVLAALGINFFVLHGFSYSNDRQGSQADWPVSFFFQNPYWRHFRFFSSYIARLSRFGALGVPRCRVGVLYPITALRERFADGKPDGEGKALAKRYNAVLEELLRGQIDADLADEDSLASGLAADGELRAGAEAFRLIAVPGLPGLAPGSGAAGLSPAVLERLKAFEACGGRVLVYAVGEGEGLEAAAASFRAPILVRDLSLLPGAVKDAVGADLELLGGADRDLFYSRRDDGPLSIFLLANACGRAKRLRVRFAASGAARRVDLETGRAAPLAGSAAADGRGSLIDLDLSEDQACVVVFDSSQSAFASGPAPREYLRDLSLDPASWTLVPLPLPEAAARAAGLSLPEGAAPAELLHADFRLDGGAAREIRVANRRGEGGRCGRHVGDWLGAWITRRPSWSDDSCEERLYFRRDFSLESAPSAARACLAVPGSWTLHVNGREAASGAGWREPAVVDLSGAFRSGPNSVCVSVRNPDRLPGKNMLEAESFDPDSLTSLLAEFEFSLPGRTERLGTDDAWICASRAEPGWTDADFAAAASAVRVDVKAISFPWGLEKPEQWQFAWVRGAPPLLPWGQVPLFRRPVSWPRRVEYRLALPAGTLRVYAPALSGAFSCFLDGRNVDADFAAQGWAERTAADAANPAPGSLAIEGSASGPDDGLAEPPLAAVGPAAAGSADWRELGWKRFSGEMEYRCVLDLDHFDPALGWELDLGTVQWHCEVFANGAPCGVRLWAPYRWELGPALRRGRNELRLVVSNLAANERSGALFDEGAAHGWNRYWLEDNIERDAPNLSSGVFGPAFLRSYRKS